MTSRRPNFLVLMADQLSPQMTSVHGHPAAHTPNLERLAEQGTVFDAGYTTCPVCVPARYSMLTGLYLAGTHSFDNGSILPSDVPTHNHYLNIAGYDTVLAGKAHFVGPDQLHGFNKRLMTNIYPTDMHWMPKRDASLNYTDLHPNPIAIDYIGENVGERQWSMLIDYDEEAVLQARRYMATKRSIPSGSAQKPRPPRDDRPFFLMVSLNHPHEPFHVLKRHWDIYKGRNIPIPCYPVGMEETYTSMDRTLAKLHGTDTVDIREPGSLRRLHRSYLAAVSYFDEKVGQLVDSLDEFGLRDDTVVIVVSDHGDMLGHRGMVQKRVFYEHSSRVEFIVSVPESMGSFSRGERCADPISLTDFAPTILDLAGLVPEVPMDGQSLVPQLRGSGNPNRTVFCENYSEGVTRVCLMARRGPYKYIFVNGGERRLFDVVDDPMEWQDLLKKPSEAKHQAIAAEMERLILSRFDVDSLECEAARSHERRSVVKRSIEATGGSRWNFRPPMDIDNMYWRNED